VRFELSGPAGIAAVDNGNAASLEPFQGPERRAFGGLALVVVRTRRGETGPIALTAVVDGLAPGRATLASR
jgi:beta-galactosidase